MARIGRSDLLIRFEDAIRLNGWTILYLSKAPARYKLIKGDRQFTVRVYIWNITPGGRGRPDSEYRIQVTGFNQFETEPAGVTLILGWWEDIQVFAGWDIRHHLGPLGKSPSMQVSISALQRAQTAGFAPYKNQNSETAIAFRPDFAGTYVEFHEALHDSGAIPAEASLLERLSQDAEAVTEQDIDDDVTTPARKLALRQTKRALRANDFARRVLGAYGQACAMCGVQLRLVDGAHIVPVEQPGSTDQTNNGVALCALHHRAYDRSLVTFDNAMKIHISNDAVRRLKAENLIAGLADFRAGLRPFLAATSDKKDRPLPKFIARANSLRGWNFG